jgi:HK97 family phage prohead protease
MTTITEPQASASTREAQFRAIRLSEFVDVELRAVDGAKREFEGIAVPWDREIDVDGWSYEVWRSGAFDHQLRAANRIKVGDGHIPLGGNLIGAMRELRNDAKGLYVRGKVTEGVRAGDEALALMGDKALDELSIGFYRVPGGDTVTRKADGRPLYDMRKANLFEVALVPFGAYGRDARVTGLREQRPGRETIVITRQLVVSVDGQSASLPFAGELGDAVRVLLGPVAAGPTSAEPVVPAVAPVDPTVAQLDSVLAALPDL